MSHRIRHNECGKCPEGGRLMGEMQIPTDSRHSRPGYSPLPPGDAVGAGVVVSAPNDGSVSRRAKRNLAQRRCGRDIRPPLAQPFLSERSRDAWDRIFVFFSEHLGGP